MTWLCPLDKTEPSWNLVPSFVKWGNSSVSGRIVTGSDGLTQVKHREGGLAHGKNEDVPTVIVMKRLALRRYSIRVTVVGKIIPSNASMRAYGVGLKTCFLPRNLLFEVDTLIWTHTQSGRIKCE